ncbi:MAG: alpha/beta hydrolase [Nocardioidaceae bacterium]
MSAPVYATLTVPTEGGELYAGRWTRDDAPVAIAVHGVTANHLCWSAVAERTSCTLVAPDLRGRGRSNRLVGPAGMERHADDLRDLLDGLGLERAVLVGHSMGGFVTAAFADRHPDRCAGVVLVDGGLPLPGPPPGTTPEEALAAVIGPAAQRLTMTFPTPQDYRDFWRPHPALGQSWSPALEAYFLHDLDGTRSSVSLDAVRDDSADLLDPETVAKRVRSLPDGTPFLRAPAGLMGEPGGLYPPDLVAALKRDLPGVDVRDVEGSNHYTIVFDDPGATTIARTLDATVAGLAGGGRMEA